MISFLLFSSIVIYNVSNIKMPETKKIDEVSKDIKDIITILENMGKANDCIITLKKENEELKKKYNDLLKKYNATWI